MLVNAYILAGGRSERMGSDKALLPIAGGETLLARAVRAASAVCPCVRIVGNHAYLCTFGEVVPDTYPQAGPLGGIHAALLDSNSEWTLVLALDQLDYRAELLRFLLSAAETAGETTLAIVPECGARLQPLCALYRKPFAAVAEAALERGERKIARALEETNTQVIAEAELRAAGFSERDFENINTPEDLARAQAKLDRAPQ